MKRYRWNRRVVIGALAVLSVALLVAWAVPASATDAEAGQKIYGQKCLMCHGSGGAGDGSMGKMLKPPPPSFADADRMADRSDEELITMIKEGKSPMPSYGSRLSDSQIQDVLAYIRTLATK
jgi:high-affinity iron transporter